jgi:hypothetical protein
MKSNNYYKILDKLLSVCISRMKAIFPRTGDITLHGYQYLKNIPLISSDAAAILNANLYCLAHKINAVFCSRYSILHFRKKKAGDYFSHNNGFCGDWDFNLDSS